VLAIRCQSDTSDPLSRILVDRVVSSLRVESSVRQSHGVGTENPNQLHRRINRLATPKAVPITHTWI
jgi:hypothetical protein